MLKHVERSSEEQYLEEERRGKLGLNVSWEGEDESERNREEPVSKSKGSLDEHEILKERCRSVVVRGEPGEKQVLPNKVFFLQTVTERPLRPSPIANSDRAS